MAFKFTKIAFGAGIALAAASFSTAAFADDTAYTMGLWGDMPYAKADDQPRIPALLDDMNASDIAFSMYDGDIKDGSSKCTDDIYESAISMFNTLKKPVIYVPGDNEWTDCHRTNNGGYDNLERLDHIRKTMFTTADSFGAEKVALEHQGKPGEKFSENTRLVRGPAMFVGLNVPGSNNNKVNDDKDCTKKSARTPEQCAADNVEYVERDAANIEWLHGSFEAAKAANLKGVMLVLQGDLGFDIPETEDEDESRLPGLEGYAAFLDAVYNETAAFPGQVVLVHGDTHFFKMDKPMKDATHMLPNFTRLETFGSPNVHWVKVTVDAANRDVFTFNPMIVEANAMVGVDK
ncbi:MULTISPECIES: hypothetical protein [Alphaproteobacteria]|uniref:Calcineurin-like phosphoesterase domain-containing protein n=2 Tax=Alphaproteobacteria TaxID=28211 RepID=A0A512HG57_9HYPH|nr:MULTISPECIES: hypothetical protein [Alphaproteobacteria]GEO84429.1 hypothetical protein RNA01_13610 [Ciceribacter naphthalenivorans]GLR22392.1 hypothetical protein GCM10007920_21790 [Ciceribacter naphthalenivorans]GLT05248.1 hypothetical protein GCM10007926_21790 [Sphingomonas psychrolutea]